MAKQAELSHEEIVERFLGSGAVNFDELGKFVAEFGESIVLTGRGEYGVRFGQFNVWACFRNIAPPWLEGEIVRENIADALRSAVVEGN